MLEALALTLIKAMLGYMVEQQLDSMRAVHIEGAPSWYMQQVDDLICTSAAAQQGELAAIPLARQAAQQQLLAQLQTAMETTAQAQIRRHASYGERQLIEQFVADAQLPRFVSSHAQDKNIEYRATSSTAFARVCIQPAQLAAYQQQRLQKLTQDLTHQRRDDRIHELDSSLEEAIEEDR